ncbi:hypothetical protein QTL86_11925 [Cellulosilyticum sp. ST5]|uniref:hypothetical protein n=1 Tax=Cellulosilyticum sp. ST5 TaxID=3055805 RepID=UPI0039774173
MNKSDKYYLKQGKLELSMLDDDDDEIELRNSLQTTPKKDLFADLEFPHTKRIRENRTKSVRAKEPKLKVTQDIYNTLHTMGQFLTKTDEGEAEEVKQVPPRKPINAAKAQKLEQIASTLKIQEIELPPRTINRDQVIEAVENKEGIPFESIPIDKQKEEITGILPNREVIANKDQETINTLQEEIAAEINELLAEEKELEGYQEAITEVLVENVLNEEELANSKEVEARAKPMTVVSAIEKEVQQVYYGANHLEDNKVFLEQKEEDPNKDLKQSHIDEVLKTFFGNVTPGYTYAKELKRHIDKQIAAIENYE